MLLLHAFLSLLQLFPSPARAGSALDQLSGGAPLPEVPAAQAPASPFFPEDGSAPMKAWYTRGVPPAPVQAALAAEGVEPRDIRFDYEWAQDIAFFRQDGSLVLLADAPPKLLENLSLTMGVLNNEDGFPALTALSEQDAQALGVPFRRLQHTFLEGGALITGYFPGGEPYAIVTQSPVEGAALIYEYRTGRAIDEAAAKALVAADLGVAVKDLFVVPSDGHLDLVITPLRGGTLLVTDPSRELAVMQALLPKAPAGEQKRLKAMIKFYKEGWKRYPDSKPEFPHTAYEQRVADAAAAILQARFKVVRAAGSFKELKKYANAESLYPAERINFFNGFTGSTASGELFQVTNSGDGLTSLENYWAQLLKGLGAARVHFPGSYSLGAGMDCTGVPSPR